MPVRRSPAPRVLKPDVAGNVLDKSVESQRIVETLERIGYTEDEIEAFIKNWGDKSDKQTAKGIL